MKINLLHYLLDKQLKLCLKSFFLAPLPQKQVQKICSYCVMCWIYIFIPPFICCKQMEWPIENYEAILFILYNFYLFIYFLSKLTKNTSDQRQTREKWWERSNIVCAFSLRYNIVYLNISQYSNISSNISRNRRWAKCAAVLMGGDISGWWFIREVASSL